jgi:serine/threonine-protein kinase
MKRSGPLYTLLAGLALAVVMLSLNATTGSSAASYREPPPSATPSSPSPSPTPTPTGPTPTPTPSATPRPDADYAGHTVGRAAGVAIAVREGKAIAYVCDGRTKEAWLRGDVDPDGGMRLTGKNGSKLVGTLAGNRITGTIELTDRTWKFTAAKAVKPSGLYRATARVSGAKIDGGWIVLPDGKQVGIVDRDGAPSAAPSIDPETGAVTIDGAGLTAKPVVP